MARATVLTREPILRIRSAVCPPEFATTNRICERWNVSVGLGIQSDRWQDGGKTPPPPLDDATAIIVDKIILSAPPKTKKLVFKWYRTDLPDTVIARDLHLQARMLPSAWLLTLNYLRWRFAESNYKPLLAILRWRDA
jgi:hypothetical protein